MTGPGRPGRPRSSGAPPSTRGRGRRPGRPRQRRDSNSTVSSVDASGIQYLRETSVLKKTKIQDPEQWPCFVLTDAVVYRKTQGGHLQIANVCNVDLEGPFIVRGKVEIDADNKQYLRQRKLESAYIEVAASVMYSIGLSDSGPVIWAAGQAGWLELNPAAEYATMYETVCEGISFYYLVLDVYLQAPKSKKRRTAHVPLEEVLFQYALASGELTLPEAKKRAQHHAEFLCSHFKRGIDLDWKNTSLGRWMTSQNPELVRKLQDAENSRLNVAAIREPSPESEGENESEPHTTRDSEADDVHMDDVQTDQPDEPLRVITPIHPPRPGQIPSVPRGTPVEPGSQSEDPVRFLLDFFEEVLERTGDIAKVREGTVHSNMYLKCSIKTYHAAKDVTHYYAKRLVASLNPKWYDSPFFQWLKARREEPWQSTILKEEEVAAQCVRRRKTTAAGSLRATAGKHYPTGPRPSGKNAALRPGGSSKRPIFNDKYGSDDYDDDQESDNGRPFKIARTSSDDEDGDEDQDQDSDEEEIDMTSVTAPNARPYSTTPIPVPVIPTETVRVVVRTESIPSMSPVGANGTWKCQEEGCHFVVRAADTQKGEDEITGHFKEHTERANKINLALAEGTRGHLPINHLLEKIRTLGDAPPKTTNNGKKDGSDEPKYPEPIKRRLFL